MSPMEDSSGRNLFTQTLVQKPEHVLVPLFLLIISELGSLSQTQSYLRDLEVLRTISVMVDFGALYGKRHVGTPRKENILGAKGRCWCPITLGLRKWEADRSIGVGDLPSQDPLFLISCPLPLSSGSKLHEGILRLTKLLEGNKFYFSANFYFGSFN